MAGPSLRFPSEWVTLEARERNLVVHRTPPRNRSKLFSTVGGDCEQTAELRPACVRKASEVSCPQVPVEPDPLPHAAFATDGADVFGDLLRDVRLLVTRFLHYITRYQAALVERVGHVHVVLAVECAPMAKP